MMGKRLLSKYWKCGEQIPNCEDEKVYIENRTSSCRKSLVCCGIALSILTNDRTVEFYLVESIRS